MNAPVESFERIELVMNASQDVDIIVPLREIVRLSKYPFRNDTWLGMGHTQVLRIASRMPLDTNTFCLHRRLLPFHLEIQQTA